MDFLSITWGIQDGTPIFLGIKVSFRVACTEEIKKTPHTVV